MDIIRDEFIVFYRIETGMPMRVYSQSGTYLTTENHQDFCKKKSYAHMKISNNISSDYFQGLFEKYTSLMQNKELRTEVKICVEQGCKIISTSANSTIQANISRFSINFAVWSGNGTRYDRGFGSTTNPGSLNDLEQEFERLYKSAEDEKNQEQLKNGFYNVILDPEATGLFVHEIVGHCMEADIWESNDELKKLFAINNQVSSPQVSIFDDPNISLAFGSYDYDDEGVKAQNVALISSGTVTDFMTSNSTAHIQSNSSNGHARAISYKHPPIVRMSNTFLKSGKVPIEDLFAGMESGLYLRGAGESRGGISFSIKFPECYTIKGGQICNRVSSAKMFGKLEQVLGSIVEVADDFKILGGGDGGCGKFGQWPMAVSAGGPHIRINSAFILG